jgi:hypothetical protein
MEKFFIVLLALIFQLLLIYAKKLEIQGVDGKPEWAAMGRIGHMGPCGRLRTQLEVGRRCESDDE